MATSKRYFPGDDLRDAFLVRSAVFVDEQGFSAEGEFDDIDSVAYHVVLFDGDKPVATARLFTENGEWHVGRVATMKACRGTGLGRVLMEEVEAFAKDLGASKTVLGAQKTAEGFYAQLGYQSFGEPYMDEHCEHVWMEKQY